MLAKRDGRRDGADLCRAYVDLAGSVIDICDFSAAGHHPHYWSHVRKADIVGVSSLRRGCRSYRSRQHGDEKHFPRGYRADEIKLPPCNHYWRGRACGNDVMIANDNLRIEQGDHVIMFLTDKSLIPTSNVCSSQSFSSSNLRGRLFSALLIPFIYI